MQGAWTRGLGKYAMGAALLVTWTGTVAAGGDDSGSGLLGRLFKFGGGSSSNGQASQPLQSQPSLPYGGTYGNALPPGGSSSGPSTALPTFGGLPQTPPLPSDSGPAQRVSPRPRVSTAVTTADPVLTRFALGRSNDGSSFGMFMQIFADGTVVDSEGVHHVRAPDLKPVLDAVQSGELYRLRGHCGAPSTDFIEYVHLVVYERRFGRLQANSFSYSGNPQGCDHIVRHLHAALENLQAKLSHQPGTEVAGSVPMAPAAGVVRSAPVSSAGPAPYRASPAQVVPASPGRYPAVPSTSPAGPVIPLTPVDSSH
jgi:hypothetical protein